MQRFKNSNRFINDLSVTIPFSIAKNNKWSAMSKVRHQSVRLIEKHYEHQDIGMYLWFPLFNHTKLIQESMSDLTAE